MFQKVSFCDVFILIIVIFEYLYFRRYCSNTAKVWWDI